MGSEKRAVSYSDSFIYINGTTKLEPLIVSPWEEPVQEEVIQVYTKPEDITFSWFDTGIFFIIKGSLHIFFISSFETIFYFLFVSKNENDAILNTINTYYTPLIQSCDTWKNTTRELLLDMLRHEINRTIIDSKGSAASLTRQEFNRELLNWSVAYSGICLTVFISMVGIVLWKKISISWKNLFLENIAFVLLLGSYEYFFFKSIIYKYQTISTDELNKYLVDGAFQCLE